MVSSFVTFAVAFILLLFVKHAQSRAIGISALRNELMEQKYVEGLHSKTSVRQGRWPSSPCCEPCQRCTGSGDERTCQSAQCCRPCSPQNETNGNNAPEQNATANPKEDQNEENWRPVRSDCQARSFLGRGGRSRSRSALDCGPDSFLRLVEVETEKK